MKGQVILDTGPLVAFLNSRDKYHDWAVTQFAQIQPPLLTCEAVVSRPVFCSPILTLDSDFKIHRKHKRRVIPLLLPTAMG